MFSNFSGDDKSGNASRLSTPAPGWPTRRRLLQGLGYGGLAAVGAVPILPSSRAEEQSRAGNLIRTFTGHSDWVQSVALSSDDKAALSGSSDQTLKLWEVATGEELRTFRGHS